MPASLLVMLAKQAEERGMQGLFAPQVYGPPFLPLATEVGDGVSGHPMWSTEWAVDRIGPEIEKALARCGRRREEIAINLWPWAAPNPNESEAIEDARPTMAFYGG
jgi:alkanesulfonate monooxygenase SsuD/methylene tetrahydromethanopterin reductase-like flavin-dependent oxidoreductase (luciferase family)